MSTVPDDTERRAVSLRRRVSFLLATQSTVQQTTQVLIFARRIMTVST